MYRVDVIIPFHRADRYLYEAIESIQNSRNVVPRIILVDDRSVRDLDFKASLARTSDIVLLESNGVGYSEALRIAFQQVCSPYIAFLDSDDLSHPDRLSLQIEFMEHTFSEVSICALRRISSEGRRKIWQPPIFRDPELLKISNLLGSINSNSSWVWKKELMDSLDFMPFEFQSIDWATTLLLKAEVKVSIVPKRLYSYRSHEGQMTKNQEYKSEAFKEIYPLWLRLNNSLNLNELEFEQALMVAAPWAFGNKGSFPFDWCKEFLNLPQVRASTDYGRLRKLLMVRYIQSRT